MNEKCDDCGKCCCNTEMILSEYDIKLILSKLSDKNLSKKEFVNKNENNFFQLKNINGYCVFFDIKTKLCKIYDFRPEGCKFYPMIYDQTERICLLDDDCPRKKIFYSDSKEFSSTCNNLKKYLKEQLFLKF